MKRKIALVAGVKIAECLRRPGQFIDVAEGAFYGMVTLPDLVAGVISSRARAASDFVRQTGV